jgi:hypothetical protein
MTADIQITDTIRVKNNLSNKLLKVLSEKVWSVAAKNRDELDKAQNEINSGGGGCINCIIINTHHHHEFKMYIRIYDDNTTTKQKEGKE